MGLRKGVSMYPPGFISPLSNTMGRNFSAGWSNLLRSTEAVPSFFLLTLTFDLALIRAPRGAHMGSAPPSTSVLFIDESQNQRTYWGNQLKQCSSDYEILEASDGPLALDLCRSRRIDCIVIELSLPDESGFEVLMTLVALAPHVPVVALTFLTHPGIWELAKQNGVHTCLAKKFTTGEDLDEAVQRAVAFVGQMPKEDREPSVRRSSEGGGPGTDA
jgi:CheY-like chemotaxis protein